MSGASGVPAIDSRADITAAIRAAIESVAPETDFPSIRADRPLRHQIDLDSLDWQNVISSLEERLQITIPESDHLRLDTLDGIVAYAAARRAAAGREAGPPPAQGPSPLGVIRRKINGVDVTLRPIHPGDLALESDFVGHLSAESRYDRFMATVRELTPQKLRYLTDVDQVQHVALAAIVERDGQEALVGAARYVIEPGGRSCEFAIAIGDDWQGTGLGGVLMHALIRIARARGLETMEGIVLAANTRMLKFTRQLGFRAKMDPDDRTTMRVVRELHPRR